MTLSRRAVIQTAAALPLTVPLLRPARAQAPAIKIGVLNDLSGPYANTGGITSVICARQALEDYGVSTKGMNVEVI
jgi:branched-chain amino acid transport system substrate-binding protein